MLKAVEYLRAPATSGNRPADPDEPRETRADTHRRFASQLSRAWALCAASGQLDELRGDVRFYEEVRVWMAKLDAEARQSRGEPIPADIQRLLGALIAESTQTGDVLDIYEAAGYTNQQLTSAEVIAELIALAKDVAAEGERGNRFDPPLEIEELTSTTPCRRTSRRSTFSATVSSRRSPGTWSQSCAATSALTGRCEDVLAKLRTTIKRLLMKYGYPPDQQQAAIKEVINQMEGMAPRYVRQVVGA